MSRIQEAQNAEIFPRPNEAQTHINKTPICLGQKASPNFKFNSYRDHVQNLTQTDPTVGDDPHPKHKQKDKSKHKWSNL